MLSIRNLKKTYGDFTAVKGISLEVRPGDIYGFIGHNGAGKTTTIRCAVGVLDFDEGDILIDGVSIKSDPMACKKKLAYIPDNPDIYGSLTGIKYINFIADIYGVPKAEREKSIAHYAELFEMKGNLGDKISSYSHGMKQKIVIIAALVHSPRLLILDEPFVGLDPKAAFTVKNELKAICERGGAVFFSTHVLEVAEKICNKIAIIKDGEIITAGETADVKGNETLEEIFLELTENE